MKSRSLPIAMGSITLALLPAFARAQASAPPDLTSPSVVVTGEGVVQRAPNRAFVDMTVETRARTPREAQAQNATIMTNVQQKLREVNLPKDAVRTAGYGVQPEFDFTNGRQVLRDYVARNMIEVRLDDVNRVGEIVDLGTSSGATSIGDVRFDLKERATAEREALASAVADARAKAEAIASAAGRTVIGPWRIVEEGASAPGPRPMPGVVFRAAAAAPPTPITGGDIEIRAHVTLTALLK